MSLTTVSSASLFNIPRVFGLGRAASPPRTRTRQHDTTTRGRKSSSSPQKRKPTGSRQPSPPPETRGRSRRTGVQTRPASPPRRGASRSRANQSPPRTRRTTRDYTRRRSISTISTLSSFVSTRPPPPDDEPRSRSLRESLRVLAKQPKSNTDRVDKWRLGVAVAVTTEGGANPDPGAAGASAPNAPILDVAEENARSGSVGEAGITNPQGKLIPVVKDQTNLTLDQDLQSLSDEDIFALTQNIKSEEASRRPLISPISPLAELRAEFSPYGDANTLGAGISDYEGPNANVLRKIDWLQTHGGWKAIRRTRGDGDCFYRCEYKLPTNHYATPTHTSYEIVALAFAYVEKIMTAPDPGLAVATSLSHLESTLPLLEQAGFQKIVYEDFYDPFTDLIQQVIPQDGDPPLTDESLLEQFQDPEISNSIVVFLRLLTSAYIRMSPPEDFTPFLIHPDTGEMVDVRTFVETFVEATGREADHPQIMALSKALRVHIEVAYLDNSGGTLLKDGTLRIDFVKFAPGAEEDGMKPVVLLYRPGHYDTLEEKIEG
ncbi:Peptidase C65 otubain protein [Ceratobasidium theobromae]|uniref:Peptidase C65 otubain protein n=1 Tax=Ceratobasidium theobromae TaxID=1582974 RepID=A0A5N5QEB6_9AGAM|nr:Peptidase C65 otubain protein [Ceratobasidium theobromae]